MRPGAWAALVGLLIVSGCTRDAEQIGIDRVDPVSVSIGDTFEVNDVELTVLSVEATLRTLPRDGGRESFPLLAVSVSATNRTTVVDDECVEDGGSESECRKPIDSLFPNVELRCDGVTTRGEPFAGSTVDAGGYLPMGATVTGRVLVVFPPDPDETLTPVETCPGATLRFSQVNNAGTFATAVLDVDDEVVAAAISAPVGPGRPLTRRAS